MINNSEEYSEAGCLRCIFETHAQYGPSEVCIVIMFSYGLS